MKPSSYFTRQQLLLLDGIHQLHTLPLMALMTQTVASPMQIFNILLETFDRTIIISGPWGWWKRVCWVIRWEDGKAKGRGAGSFRKNEGW